MFANHEQAFLAQVAIGVFSVDMKGRIWRHFEISSGTRKCRSAMLKPIGRRRAETGLQDGYLQVPFSDGQKRNQIRAHRIVWMMHNQQPIPAGLQINHKNGKRQDNRPINLETVTAKENMQHAAKVLKSLGRADQLGTKNPSAKLTVSQVVEIRLLLKAGGLTCGQIADRFGVTVSNIHHISKGNTWKHVKI